MSWLGLDCLQRSRRAHFLHDLHEYNDNNGEGFLTKEIYMSLSHTVTTLVHLIIYLLKDCDMPYSRLII